MTEPEERSNGDVPPEERVEEDVERRKARRPAPIDENVSGEINAALPDEDREADRERI